MNERKSLADKLLEIKPDDETFAKLPIERYGNGFGKPVFPKDMSLSTSLRDLARVDSWFIFKLLNLDSEFLSKLVETWEQNQAFRNAQKKVLSLNVTNDAAERAVKLSSDFLNAAKREDNYHYN